MSNFSKIETTASTPNTAKVAVKTLRDSSRPLPNTFGDRLALMVNAAIQSPAIATDTTK